MFPCIVVPCVVAIHLTHRSLRQGVQTVVEVIAPGPWVRVMPRATHSDLHHRTHRSGGRHKTCTRRSRRCNEPCATGVRFSATSPRRRRGRCLLASGCRVVAVTLLFVAVKETRRRTVHPRWSSTHLSFTRGSTFPSASSAGACSFNELTLECWAGCSSTK